ncbi:MAG: hypothetical protein Q4A55_07755 [Aerococcus sp.]|nr:hypothetical protein [Aerococcus sp.]
MTLSNDLPATTKDDQPTKETSDWKGKLPIVLLACGTIAGACLAAVLTDQFLANRQLSAKDVLSQVKDYVKTTHHNMEGSWIEVQPVNVERFNQKQSLYYGGFSYREQGKMQQFEFYADPTTGLLIDVFRAH